MGQVRFFARSDSLRASYNGVGPGSVLLRDIFDERKCSSRYNARTHAAAGPINLTWNSVSSEDYSSSSRSNLATSLFAIKY